MIKKLFKKHKKLKIFSIVAVVVLLFWFWPSYNKNIDYGVTFSAKYARELGLDPKEVLEKTFTELGFKKVRLIMYWDDLETDRDSHDLTDLGWQIKMAEKYNAEVILTVGRRVPRWPECHIPEWAHKESLELQKEEVKELIEIVVNEYENSPAVKMWQVENEVFLTEYARKFCGKYADENFLDEEIALVKSISNKPILITDSGELSTWRQAYPLGDKFGSTMYLYVGNDFIDDMRIPVTPNFYNWKLNLMNLFFGKKESILVELSMEPWLPQPIIETPMSMQIKKMSLERIKKTINYASRTKFNEQYLWGVEWWYYLSERNHPEILDYIKSLKNK